MKFQSKLSGDYATEKNEPVNRFSALKIRNESRVQLAEYFVGGDLVSSYFRERFTYVWYLERIRRRKEAHLIRLLDQLRADVNEFLVAVFTRLALIPADSNHGHFAKP